MHIDANNDTTLAPMSGPDQLGRDAGEIARLASLDTMAYERERNAAAAKLGVRAAVLDAQVIAARKAAEADGAPSPIFSDEDLAGRFSAQHAGDLRYVAKWGQWFSWTGTTWQPDETLAVYDKSRAVCREAAKECNDPDVSRRVASAGTVAAIERLARADRRQAAVVDEWDSDPWLLNTPGGIIDLRTGKIDEHDPDHRMTKVTRVAPEGDCFLWLEFLDRITDGNAELCHFLQRIAGYSLTGSTREHALFFGYGTGANGKGTFLNTLAEILGDYAKVSPMDTFTASHGDRHPTDLAMLRGARLVTSQETDEGRKWAEAKIKAMTGGDPITARFMRQDFFTFTPAFKLFIAGNHKPSLRNVDEAIRRRFHLIPFTVTIPPSERDSALSEKLREEWGGILNWAIRGCIEWQRIGLAPPQCVLDATEDYLGSEDTLGTWLKERCREVGYGGETSSNLFRDFAQWATAAGERPGSQKAFSQAMEARGYRKKPGARHATFEGVALDDAHPSYAEPPDDRA